MKKLILISIIILSVVACKKTKYSPEGPTDVRVKNLTTLSFTEVRVTIDDSTKAMGDIIQGGVSEYIEFHKAFPKAEITARIGGVLYTTGVVNTGKSTTMTYIGQAKITYEVFISDAINKKLSISNCSLDAPLK
jgi:hypothetical protein